MLFSIHALDAPNTADTRRKVHPDHLGHINTANAYGVTIVVGGPLIADDGTHSIGSMMVVEAPDRAAAEKFNRDDPLFKSGVWENVEIRRFDRKK